VLITQQMNHVLGRRAQEGFCVERFDCGVHQRPAPRGGGDGEGAPGAGAGAAAGESAGCTQHNLYFNILLKKVVPLLPMRRLPQPQQAMGTAASQPQ